MDFRPTSDVFDRLLEINPWARPHWERRLELIDAGFWNVNSLNYSGNAATRDWLADFHRARSDATLERLRNGVHGAWNADVHEIILPLFGNADFIAAREGSPLIPVVGGALTNRSERLDEYSVGMFKADVLMLSQAGIHDRTVSEVLDLSGLAFTIGPWVYTSRLSLVAHETRFGPYGDFVSCGFDRFDVSGAEFFGQIGFTMGRFYEDAVFAGASFMEGASIQGVSFDRRVDFSDARFGGWCAFAGTRFGGFADFRGAAFLNDTTFENATFEGSANFDGASFASRPSVAGVKPEVADMIRAASR